VSKLSEKMAKIRRFNKERSSGGVEMEKFVIAEGNNLFRVADDLPVFKYEHWFTAACGTPVHSFCSRDYEGEADGADKKSCKVCDVVTAAWEVWNDPDKHSEEDVYQAGVILGKEKDQRKGFAASWSAKVFAYINVIPREDKDNWCAKNKHTKVLSKSAKQAGITAGEKGIFDEFIELVDDNGDWDEFDVRMKKSGKKLDTRYRVYKDKEYALSDEEKGYTRYEFDTLLKPTPEKVLDTWLNVGVKGGGNSAPPPPAAEEDAEEDAAAEVDEEETKPKKKVLGKTKLKLKKEPEPEPETPDEEEEVEDEVEEEEKPTPKPKPKTKLKSKTKLKAKPKVEPEPEPDPEPDEPDDDVGEAECPECSTMIPGDSESCPNCGAKFTGFDED